MKRSACVWVMVLLLQPSFSLASDFLLTMNSYGPVKIGMEASDAYTRLRALMPVNEPQAASGCTYYYASDGLSFMLDDDRVVRIETSLNQVITPSGVRVGDSLSKLKNTFGDRLDGQPNHYQGPESRTIKLFSKDRSLAMRFEVVKNRIVEIYSGYEHAIHYVEGCA